MVLIVEGALELTEEEIRLLRIGFRETSRVLGLLIGCLFNWIEMFKCIVTPKYKVDRDAILRDDR
jgi:hypothetical protein